MYRLLLYLATELSNERTVTMRTNYKRFNEMMQSFSAEDRDKMAEFIKKTKRLSPRQRELLILRHNLGGPSKLVSISECAKLMKLTENSCYRLMCKAITRLSYAAPELFKHYKIISGISAYLISRLR